MTRADGSGTAFTFLEEPQFEKRNGTISCRVRVRCNGVDSVVELELDDGEWKVVNNDDIQDDCVDVVGVVRDEFRKSTWPPPRH